MTLQQKARGKFSAIKMKGIGSKLIKCIQMSFLVQVSIPISSDGPGWLERTEGHNLMINLTAEDSIIGGRTQHEATLANSHGRNAWTRLDSEGFIRNMLVYLDFND